MRINKPHRGEIIAITVTEQEKAAIAAQAEKENRTISGYVRYRLQDILDGVNNDTREAEHNGKI